MTIPAPAGTNGLYRLDEIALHILDVARNSIEAGARNIGIGLTEETAADRITLEVQDDGPGIPEGELSRIKAGEQPHGDPGGAGLLLLAQVARSTGGSLEIESGPGLGTRLRAVFRQSDPARPPVGDLEWTLIVLIAAHPDVNFVFRHSIEGRVFELESAHPADGTNRSAAEAVKSLRTRIRDGEASLCLAAQKQAWR